MTDYDADHRDAAYLASQLHTNGVVMTMKARMQRARAMLHQILLDVNEEAAFSPPVDIIPVPKIDLSLSRPRRREYSDSDIPTAQIVALPTRRGT